MNKQVKKLLDDYKPEHTRSHYTTVRDYVNYLKTGSEDGWIKVNQKEFKAIVWMDKNIDKCIEYIQ